MRKGDFIFIKDLIAKTNAGLDGWQRSIIQPLKIGIGINVGNRLRRMALTDDIRRTLNYDSLSRLIVQKLERSAYGSIDEAAQSVSKAIQPFLNKGELAKISIDQAKALLLAKSREIRVTTANTDEAVETLKELRLPVIIGINELERICKQEIQIDIQVVRNLDKEIFTHSFVSEIAGYVLKSEFFTIESFVNALAKFVLQICEKQQLIIHEVKVYARKPSALNLAESAGVQVTRKPSDFAVLPTETLANTQGGHVVYLAFGTNQGNRLENVKQSIDELSQRNIHVARCSALYQSEPMYYTDQPRFLNGVFECRTGLEPHALLKELKHIEYNVFKRVKQFDNGPRPMDLDILLYDNEIVQTDLLTIPHRDMLNRSFVLRPLNDLLSVYSDARYTESSEGGETTVVPLFHENSPEVPKYLEFDPCYPNKRKTSLMAIMNATPDSFSDGGSLNQSDIGSSALAHIQNGANIIDVGGYSTRPGASEVTVEEETTRVCFAIKQIRRQCPQSVISVDTFRGSVAREALECGANIINDVFSGTLDSSILKVAAETGAPIILSHARGTPETMKMLTDYPEGVVRGVAAELRSRIDEALSFGCKPWQLILDPGLGFAKTPEQDLELIRNFKALKRSSLLNDKLPVFPWLVGPSRKSFIGHVTGEKEPKQRLAGTLAAITALIQQGADIVRVHDTREVQQALTLADKIYI